jgi:hypothetical protein
MSTSPAKGTCFGFEVYSDLPFRYLRGGTGDPLRVLPESDGEEEARISNLIAEYSGTAEAPFEARLYGGDARFRLWIGGSGGGWFGIDAEARTITVPPARDHERREARLWGMPALLLFLCRGDLPVHAAAVEVDHSALLLAGASGSGKTTLAAALVRNGQRLLAEDLSCVRLQPTPSVVPGPAVLRLRPDVAGRLGFPYVGAEARADGRLHIDLPKQTRGDCQPVRVKGIVALERGEGAPRVERISTVEAIPVVWQLSFRLPTMQDARRAFLGVTALARSVPVWKLHYPHRLDSLDETIAALMGSV